MASMPETRSLNARCWSSALILNLSAPTLNLSAPGPVSIEWAAPATTAVLFQARPEIQACGYCTGQTQ